MEIAICGGVCKNAIIQTHTIKELIDNHWNLQLTLDLLLHRL